MEARTEAYQHDIIRLQRMVAEKVKEVEEITAEKEELESNVQTALNKLWAKETELHNYRESFFEREKRLLDSLRMESVHSKELENQVQSLTNQNDTLQEQVFQLEQQLSVIKGETERRRQVLERKLPEIENTQESLKKLTVGLMDQIVDVMSVQNKHTSRDIDPSSTTSMEETCSDESSSEQCNDSEETTEDDFSAEVKAANLKKQNHDLRIEMRDLISRIEDLWHKISLDCATHKEPVIRKEPRILLKDVYQIYCQMKSKVIDLEEQNTRNLKHLQDVQEALSLTEGKIQRIWINVSLCEEKDDEIQSAWTNLMPPITEETDGTLQKIESVLSRNKSILTENQELKRLKASQEKKINDLKELVAKTRKDERGLSKELEIKSARFEELKLSTKKIIDDKDVEIEIMKEQLQENEKREGQLKRGLGRPGAGQECTDETLKKLLRSKECDFESYKKKNEKEELALRDEIQELQEALERARSDKNDLDEYCNILKEALGNFELRENITEEKEKCLKELLEQAKKKEEKLYVVAREVYDELQIKKRETLSQETTIAALQERIKCLEMEIQTIDQELQVDKKNLKNAKETEQYLQSSLQQALVELFELKAKKEEVPEGIKVHEKQQDDHQRSLLQRLQEVETIIHSAMEKSVQDLQENAVKIDGLCEENNSLKKEVNESKKESRILKKTNHRLKTLLQAMKDDLLEELKAKNELEVLLAKSNEKREPNLPEYNQSFDEQSTTSQLPDVKEAGMSSDESFVSPSVSALQGEKKTGKHKGSGSGKRKLIPKAITKRFKAPSVMSVNTSSATKEKNDELIPEIRDLQTKTKIIEDDLRNEKLEKREAVEREQRLRNVLMTVQHDKEELEREVESLSDELQKTKAQLQNYEQLNESFREEASRNVRETLEIKKVLEVIHGRTKRAHSLINKDIRSLLEVSKSKDKQMKKFEQLSEQYEKENADLQKQSVTLKKQLEDEAILKEAALEEGRQLRLSLQNILESKEKCLVPSTSPLLINNLNTDLILPQMAKDEVRAILKETLQEIDGLTSEEVSHLKQQSAEQMKEINSMRQDNEYLRNLVDAGLLEELQRAEERITYLNGQLKIFQERQNLLREASLKDKIKANEETERIYERYAELKIAMKSKEEALERYKEVEEALMAENIHLHEEIDAFKERFGADGLLPLPEKAETKREMEGWKRKCQRLQENFNKEKNQLKEENMWLHKQLEEESSLCTDLRRCKAGLEASLEKAEEKLKSTHRKLEERQEALAGFEERRVVFETKLSCLQKVNEDLQTELSKERLEADQNLIALRNEFDATAKDLKRHQREGNNLVTKVFLLENAKEKLEQELHERERKMAISLESFTEERSRHSEKVRDLRISLEEEVRRRLDLEEKMQQIMKISVTEKEQGRLKAMAESGYLEQDAEVMLHLTQSARVNLAHRILLQSFTQFFFFSVENTEGRHQNRKL